MATRKRRGRPPHDDLLTPAEWRVVHAAQHGMTNRTIAKRWGISLDAVKYHIANALAKLGDAVKFGRGTEAISIHQKSPRCARRGKSSRYATT